MNHWHLPLKKSLGIAIVPVLCLQNWVFPSIPNYYLQHWFIYFALVTILFYQQTGVFSFVKFRANYRFVFALLAVVIIFQATSLAISSMDLYGGQWPRRFLPAMGKLIVQLPFLLVLLAFWDVLIRDRSIHTYVIGGGIGSLAALVAICSVQLLFILAAKTEIPAFRDNLEFLTVVVNGIASVFEARWHDTVYDFYSLGSYTVTKLKVNGIFEEASALAANLGTFFLPPCLGFAIAGKKGCKTYLACSGILLTLLLVSSRTGIVLCISAVCMLLLWTIFHVGMRQKTALLLVGGCMVLLSLVIFFTSPGQMAYNAVRKAVPVNMPRVLITTETMALASEHLLLGVGRGMFSPYMEVRLVSSKIARTDPELRTWRMEGVIPKLSMLPCFVAEYGIILAAGLLAGVASLGAALYRCARASPHDSFWKRAFCTYLAWAVLALACSFGSVDMRNPLFNSVFFLALVLVRNYGKNSQEKFT